MQNTLVLPPTYEHIKVEILIGPLDTSKSNSKRTSGHLKVEILIRPLDTKKKQTIEVSRGPFKILGFIIRTPRRAQEKHAKYIGSPTDLSPHQSRNPNRTSGHLKIENLNGPPDT